MLETSSSPLLDPVVQNMDSLREYLSRPLAMRDLGNRKKVEGVRESF